MEIQETTNLGERGECKYFTMKNKAKQKSNSIKKKERKKVGGVGGVGGKWNIYFFAMHRRS